MAAWVILLNQVNAQFPFYSALGRWNLSDAPAPLPVFTYFWSEQVNKHKGFQWITVER